MDEPKLRPRTAREVVDMAIAENRFSERLLYGFSCFFVGIGLSVLVGAMLNREPIIALAGAISSSLFWPAYTSARKIRKENIAIRLLEAPLSRADTAKDASIMLQGFFNDFMTESPKVTSLATASLENQE